MIGPDLAQITASLMGIVSAIQILFWTLTVPREAEADLPVKSAGRAVVLRIKVSRKLTNLMLAYFVLTIFCLLEEVLATPTTERLRDLALLTSFALTTLYLAKIMVEVHETFMYRIAGRAFLIVENVR